MRRKKKKIGLPVRTLIAMFAVTLLLGGAMGGTLAWLTDSSDEVENTFTVGNINIDLIEAKYTGGTLTHQTIDDSTWTEENVTNGDLVRTNDGYKFVPGVDLPKNPTIKVVGESEACWLFVEIVETDWPAVTETGTETRKINYVVNPAWTKLEDEDGVYYQEVSTDAANQYFEILSNNKITVSTTLTKEEMDGIIGSPALTFTAYAVQKAEIATAAAAWEEVDG